MGSNCCRCLHIARRHHCLPLSPPPPLLLLSSPGEAETCGEDLDGNCGSVIAVLLPWCIVMTGASARTFLMVLLLASPLTLSLKQKTAKN